MREDDVTYFGRRAKQEQVAAREATCKAARDRHDELATMYGFRASMLTRHPGCWADALKQQVELA